MKTTASGRASDGTSLQRAPRLVGLEGRVTNIPPAIMPGREMISSYHDLRHVEQSFRMSTTDLRARPMFRRQRDAIEAHLTIGFTALALARSLQDRTGCSIRKIAHPLRPLQDVTITLAGQELTATPEPTDNARRILNALAH